MLDFQKKKRIRKIIYSPFFLVFFALVFGFVVRGVWNVYQKERLSLENLTQEQMEHEKLVIREGNLAASIDYLKTDEGIESEIRSKFRAIKDGENVAVIIDNKTPQAAPATTTAKRGFWYNLFH